MHDLGPDFSLDTTETPATLSVRGDWTIGTIGAIDHHIRQLPQLEEPYRLNVDNLGRLDTAGAFVIDRTLRQSCKFGDPKLDLVGQHDTIEALLETARRNSAACEVEPEPSHSLIDMLSRLGQGFVGVVDEMIDTLAFLGETAVVCLRLILQPQKIRWVSVVSIMEEAGLDALPIIAFLSFFIGMVVAFIGATILQQFNASILTVELIGIAVLREFGVLITGILLAGRTNSAFTAQIGSMKMRQEIDAMTSMGMEPMEVLVAPRVFAMVAITPFLAFVATVTGVFGGMIVSWSALDISPTLFFNRLQDLIPIQNFWVGLSKAPIFALIVAVVACRQGLKVGGDVQSLGRQTTASVVHAIFLIILMEAFFALFYLELGI